MYLVNRETYLRYALIVMKSIILFTESTMRFFMLTQDESGQKLQTEILFQPSYWRNRVNIHVNKFDCKNKSATELFQL